MDGLLEAILALVFGLLLLFGVATLLYLGTVKGCRQPREWIRFDHSSTEDERIVLSASYGVTGAQMLLLAGVLGALEGSFGLLLEVEGEASTAAGPVVVYGIVLAFFIFTAACGWRMRSRFAKAEVLVIEPHRHTIAILDSLAEGAGGGSALLDSGRSFSFTEITGAVAATEDVSIASWPERFFLLGRAGLQPDPASGELRATLHCVRLDLAGGDHLNVLHIGGPTGLVPDAQAKKIVDLFASQLRTYCAAEEEA